MHPPRFLAATLTIVFLVMVAMFLNREPELALTGVARALDGDSLIVEGRELRLKGIDAPEARQTCKQGQREIPCGRQATLALTRWLARGTPVCVGRETDRYGRLLVICRVNGTDIGADLVRNGHAVDYGLYPAEEKAASEDRRGVWAGTFERPEDYRRRLRDGQAVSEKR